MSLGVPKKPGSPPHDVVKDEGFHSKAAEQYKQNKIQAAKNKGARRRGAGRAAALQSRPALDDWGPR